jgi:hypothetical protein
VTKDQLSTYRDALVEARSQFKKSTNRLNEVLLESHMLQHEITRLRRTITALAAMCSESPFGDELGITDACLEVMATQRGAVSTADVVGLLDGIGFDIKGQKNVQASVHTVLARLAQKGKLVRVDSEGSVRWQGPQFDPNYVSDDIPF